MKGLYLCYWLNSFSIMSLRFIHLNEVSNVGKLIEMERIELTRGWGSESMGSYYLMGIEFLFEKVKKVVEMDSV